MSDQQPFDMNSLLQQAQQMGEQLMAAQQEAAAQIYHGQAGGGAVKIEVTGAFDFQSVTITPDAVDPNDIEMLQDLVLAALNDAVTQIAPAQDGGTDLGGLDLGGLLGGDDGGGLGGLLGPGPE
jgi:DNA-binding YbaB/EbfC family protein